MNLENIIKFLESKDKNIKVPLGFCNPHSYRGDYYELGVEYIKDTTVGDMLDCLKEALGETYIGWKGGEFTMSEHVEVYIVLEEGSLGEQVGIVLLRYMIGDFLV